MSYARHQPKKPPVDPERIERGKGWVARMTADLEAMTDLQALFAWIDRNIKNREALKSIAPELDGEMFMAVKAAHARILGDSKP